MVAAIQIPAAPAERDPHWLAEPPGYDAFIPGGLCFVRLPHRVRLDLPSLSTLHGVFSVLLGESGVPHDPRWPVFAVHLDGLRRPAVHVFSPEAGACVANGTFPISFGGQRMNMEVGPLVRLRAPVVFGRGPRVLRVVSETPVVVRRTVRKPTEKHRSLPHTTPTTSNIASSIGRQFQDRFGVACPTAHLEVIDHQTRGVKVFSGNKLRNTFGWAGEIVVRCNAPAEWLLRLAESVGLGGRTAYGFGRVRVEVAR